MFKYIKYKLLEWKWEKILKSSRHSNWNMYWYWNDLDLDIEGRTPEEVLCGFPYIVEVGYDKLEVDYEPMFGPIHSCRNIEKWCSENCQDKVRWVWNTKFNHHMDQYLPIPARDVDFLTFGFKNERDYLWFLLKWL